MPPAFDDIEIGDTIEIVFGGTQQTAEVTGKCRDFYWDLRQIGEVVFFTCGQDTRKGTAFRPITDIVSIKPGRLASIPACVCDTSSLAAYGCKCGHWAATQGTP